MEAPQFVLEPRLVRVLVVNTTLVVGVRVSGRREVLEGRVRLWPVVRGPKRLTQLARLACERLSIQVNVVTLEHDCTPITAVRCRTVEDQRVFDVVATRRLHCQDRVPTCWKRQQLCTTPRQP